MADSEKNPKKQVAPTSDNTEGTAGGATPLPPPPPPPPSFDAGMKEELKAFLKEQTESTKQANDIARRLEDNQKDIAAAMENATKAQVAGETIDEELLETATKAQYIARAAQEANYRALRELEATLVTNQTKIDNVITDLADEAGVAIAVAKEQLSVTVDGSKIAQGMLDEIAKAKEESSKKLKQLGSDLLLEKKASQEYESERMVELDAIIASSGVGMPDMDGFSEDQKVAAIIEKTGLSLETLAVINEEMMTEMKTAGVDTSDKQAVERFKAEQFKSEKFNETVIKELVKQNDNIKESTVEKELQEQYLRMGIPAATAAIMAKDNALKETAERRKIAAEEIRIFKGMGADQKLATTIADADYRSRIEKEKEEAGLPKWFLSLQKKLDPISATLQDLLNSFNSGGMLKKIILILAVIAGVVAGTIVSAVMAIVNMFKTTGFIGGLFAKLRRVVPIVDQFAIGFGRVVTFLKEGTAVGKFFVSTFGKVVTFIKEAAAVFRVLTTGAKEASLIFRVIGSILSPFAQIFKFFMVGFRFASGFFKLLGKIFVPLGIVLTVIDGVIGAFKGFKKDGLKGIIPGIIAGIINGLTFGLIGFDSIFKWVKRLTDVALMGFKNLFAIFVFVWDYLKSLWTLVTDIFSGKGIKASFSKFFDNMGKAIGKLLYTLYDNTIGAILRLFGVSDATIKNIWTTMKKWLTMWFDVITAPIRWWWHWTKAGVEAISDGIKWVWKTIKTSVYDAFMWWWKWTKAGAEAISDGIKWVWKTIKTMVYDAFMWWWKWTKAGVEAIGDAIMWVFRMIKTVVVGYVMFWWWVIKSIGGAIIDAAKWLYDKTIGKVMKWASDAWDWTTKTAKQVSDGAKWLYDKTVGAAGRGISKAWDATKGFFGSIGDGISGLWSKSTSWVSDKASKVWSSVTGFFGSMFSWLPDSINPFAGKAGAKKEAEEMTKGMSDADKKAFKDKYGKKDDKVLKENLPENNLKQTQAEVHARHMAETSRKPLEKIVNNTTVNNTGGGGKAQPMTVIAPQPPRNSEPTIRTMQFGEQPAF